jgi:hypothetical protein
VNIESRTKGAEDLFEDFLGETLDHNHFSAPLGRGPFFDAFLGLKPQAESCSPFGTKTFRLAEITREMARASKRVPTGPSSECVGLGCVRLR